MKLRYYAHLILVLGYCVQTRCIQLKQFYSFVYPNEVVLFIDKVEMR